MKNKAFIYLLLAKILKEFFISDNQPLSMELSPAVSRSFAEIEEIVNELIGKV